ncbi:MAG: hypothetical protein JXR91_16085 [Deltaproteobacteria bacterium]|nr:hypothetical protein [Deltaproteobacteria bacterium]
MNVRKITGFNERYAGINREERNYAAIFYHALLQPENSRKFLRLLKMDEPIGNDFGIYYEYSFLRDLWERTKDNNTRKQIIKEHLHIDKIDEILTSETEEINARFGVSGRPSKTDIQSPGSWSIQKFHTNFQSSEDLLAVCKFKWSFNIKPDIVIHLDNDRAICIEAKYVSGEGHYPSSSIDKEIFNKRGIPYVGQLELQRYMMTKLLGIDTRFVFLVQKKASIKSVQSILWSEAFEAMGFKSDFPFINDFLKNTKTTSV